MCCPPTFSFASTRSCTSQGRIRTWVRTSAYRGLGRRTGVRKLGQTLSKSCRVTLGKTTDFEKKNGWLEICQYTEVNKLLKFKASPSFLNLADLSMSTVSSFSACVIHFSRMSRRWLSVWNGHLIVREQIFLELLEMTPQTVLSRWFLCKKKIRKKH